MCTGNQNVILRIEQENTTVNKISSTATSNVCRVLYLNYLDVNNLVLPEWINDKIDIVHISLKSDEVKSLYYPTSAIQIFIRVCVCVAFYIVLFKSLFCVESRMKCLLCCATLTITINSNKIRRFSIFKTTTFQ